jgi:hypothetical protein
LVLNGYEWDFRAGESAFRKAIELSPNDPVIHDWYALCLKARGRFSAIPDRDRVHRPRRQRSGFCLAGKSLAEREAWMTYLNVYPVFNSLRSEARFADLLRRVGLQA